MLASDVAEYVEALRQENRAVRERAARTMSRSADLTRRANGLLMQALALETVARALRPRVVDACPRHPDAGPGTLGGEFLEFPGGMLAVACMYCEVCGGAFLTTEQAIAAEADAEARGLL